VIAEFPIEATKDYDKKEKRPLVCKSTTRGLFSNTKKTKTLLFSSRE
jgi:hypothetical protein